MNSFCIDTRAWIVVLVILLVAPVQLAVSQQQFGRTSATGTWDDGNWERSDGSLGSPGTVDDAYIGYQDYGWLGNVSVSLSGNAEVANLILGDGTNTGALTINTGANMTTGGLFSYSGSSLIVDGSLFVDYAFLFGTNFEINGSVNVSSYIEIDGGVVTRAGDVSAQSLSLGRYGEATIFNRTSGTLTLDSLRVDSGSSLALGSGDSVRYAEVVGNGSTLIVDSPFSFANVLSVNEGSLVLNSSIDAGSIQLDNAVITRFNDASLTTSNLSVSNMTFDLDGTDNVSDSVSVSNATLNILSPTSLAGSFDSSDSIVNIEADTSLSYFSLNGSTLNLNANLDLNSGTLITNGGAIHQNGDLSSGSLHLGWAGEATNFNRTSGTLTLDSLRVDSGSSLALGSGDSVRYAEVVGNGSTLIVDSPFSFANVLSVNEGSLVLNSSIDAGSIQLDNAVITRFNDASLTTSNLSVSNMTFDLDGTDNVSDSVSVSNATLNILSPTSLAGSFDSSDSIVNIEADTSLSYFSLNGSTLNLNANLDLNSGTLITNGGAIHQNGDLSSGSLHLGWAGEATNFNRTSGTLTLDSLRVDSGSSLALGSGDSVRYAEVVGNGSTLIVDSPFSFANVLSVNEGSLVLNSSIDAGSIQLDNAVITRFNDASLTTSNLSVSNMTFDLDGTDNVSDSVSVSNATLNILSPTSLAGSFDSSDSIVNIEADTSLSYFSLNGSTLNLNANLDLNSGTLITNGGAIHQNGDLSSGSLHLGWAGEATNFNRTSGTLTLDSLRVESGSTLDLTGADTVHFIAVYADSELSFTQLAGQTTGLDLESLWLDSDANLTVIFDNPDYNGFNWGLRVFGDRQSEMNDWLAGGQLSSNFAGAGIFYDVSSFGDYTYIGAFSAVPEPASISLVFLALACGTVRMRRRRVGQ